MKKFDSGEALAKEMGLKPEQLKKTFDDYNAVVRAKKDPFGKKVRQTIFFLLCAWHVLILRSLL